MNALPRTAATPHLRSLATEPAQLSPCRLCGAVPTLRAPTPYWGYYSITCRCSVPPAVSALVYEQSAEAAVAKWNRQQVPPPPPHPLAHRIERVVVHCESCGDEGIVHSYHGDREHSEPCPVCHAEDADEDGPYLSWLGVPCAECGTRCGQTGDDCGVVRLDGRYLDLRCAAHVLIYESAEQDDSAENVARVVAQIIDCVGRAA